MDDLLGGETLLRAHFRLTVTSLAVRRLGLLALALLGLACGSARPERVVLVVIDTLRADHVSAYGGSVATPRIDSIARRGQRLERALSAFHQTSMSMGALFTGRTPALEGPDGVRLPWNGRTWCGMARFAGAEEEACIPAGLLTMGELMKASGYWTAAVVSNDLLFDPAGFSRGFDAWREVGINTRAGKTGVPAPFDTYRRGSRHVNREVDRLLAERPNDRFFLYVHYMDVHDYRIALRSYAEAASSADEAVGALLDRLEREGLLDGALVLLTADHGERLPGEQHLVEGEGSHKGNPSFGTLLRVPLLAAPPLFPQDVALVRTDQLLRALAERVGAPGEIALPAPDLEPDELFVSELGWLTYQRGRWKSMRRRNRTVEVLVDLQADPGEQRDVSRSFPEVASEHRERVTALVTALGARQPVREGLTEADRRRLEALGYLD
jgi:arylsulfatase A-like enzyme